MKKFLIWAIVLVVLVVLLFPMNIWHADDGGSILYDALLYDFEMKTNSYGYFYRSARDENLAIEGAICADGKPNVNPYQPPEFIKVINNEKNGYELIVPDVPFFKDTKIEGAKKN